MNLEFLKEFEAMNTTTQSVFDLGESGILIILKDGTNLTSWDDVDYDEVLYISEDFSRQKVPSRHRYCKNVEVIIIQNCTSSSNYILGNSLGDLFDSNLIFNKTFFDLGSLKALYAINWDTSNVINMQDMFCYCYSLEYIFGLESWDTSNVENFWAMFADCCSLKTLDGLENWDFSSAVNMESMFEYCISLENISFASDWDMSNVENIFEMFKDCYSLKDVSCLNWKFKNLKNGDFLFINSNNIEKFPDWYDDEFIGSNGIVKQLENMDDKSIMEKIVNDEFDVQNLFVAVSNIYDENMLIELLNDDSMHYYAKRSALLNPNLKNRDVLERFALCGDNIERLYAIENINFDNVGILKKLAKNDYNTLVRIKSGLKLKEMLYDKFGQINLKDL